MARSGTHGPATTPDARPLHGRVGDLRVGAEPLHITTGYDRPSIRLALRHGGLYRWLSHETADPGYQHDDALPEQITAWIASHTVGGASPIRTAG
jgi:hypothetical protein